MDYASFAEICLHQLKMSGVRKDERLIVLTQGNERLDYADAFMAAGWREYVSHAFARSTHHWELGGGSDGSGCNA